MRTRLFALIVGIAYVVGGLAGFVPGLSPEHEPHDLTINTAYRDVLGLFPANILHHFVHLAVGVLGLLAYRSFAAARNFARGLAIFYAVLGVMGLIEAGNLNTTFDLIPLFGNDIWLHLGTAAIAAYFGFGPVPAGEGYDEPTGARTA
jgi:hypothetical protein